MSVWFTQTIGGRCHVIDFLTGHTHGLDWYATELRRKPYQYGEHYAPHDIKVRELSSGNARIQIAGLMGIHFQPQPKLAVADGINAVRRMLPLCVFDGKRCEKGLDALRSYRREYDDKLAVWKNEPVHDWASNPADALRTRAVAWQSNLQAGGQRSWAESRYDVWRTPEEQDTAEMHPGKRYSRRFSRSQETQSTAEVNVEHGSNWWGNDDYAQR
jgi:hypothetical protein